MLLRQMALIPGGGVPFHFGPATRKSPDFVAGVRMPAEAKSLLHMPSACTTMYRSPESGMVTTIGSSLRSTKPCDHNELTLIRTTALKSGATWVRIRPNLVDWRTVFAGLRRGRQVLDVGPNAATATPSPRFSSATSPSRSGFGASSAANTKTAAAPKS